MKYIVTKDEDGKEELFMFPKNLNHDQFAEVVNHIKTFVNGNPRDWVRMRRKPIAAGFTDGTRCTGRSETLNLNSRGRLDEMLITV
ncbi:hypothetical protein QDY63_14870 [Pseudomonas brenneri]|uniref:hypothetical protein n=1 Tax=Pseudomonas brenneri TaxID=129817 RepID=UPI0025A29B12|nr:hypothetical protein [Pseudomonas brenneri]WJM88683.1 hypothetical protein QDY63_14870 [Pseudomonas brenneri]